MNELLTILILIIAGNGAPIMVRYVLGERVRQPVDCHWTIFDGRRLFGDSKTWIGLVSIPLVSLTTAWILGESVSTGLWVGLGVMCGDLFSSFVKRRLGREQSSMAIATIISKGVCWR